MENNQQLLEDFLIWGALTHLLDAKDVKEVMSDMDVIATTVVGVKLMRKCEKGADTELGKKLLKKYVKKVIEGGGL